MIDRSSFAAVRRAAIRLRRREDLRPAFLDGLLLGAMVGAAIAGSSLWSRWRSGRTSRDAAEPSSAADSPAESNPG